MFSFISTTGAAYKPRVDRPISAVMSCPKLGCASARLAMDANTYFMIITYI
jgi:hypothetical protein